MKTQTCPNCGTGHDVAIYVSGQKILCSRCGIRFEVKRTDVSMTPRPPRAGHSAASAPTSVERSSRGSATPPGTPGVPAPSDPVVLDVASQPSSPSLYFDRTAIRGPGQATAPPEPPAAPPAAAPAPAAAAATPAPEAAAPPQSEVVIPGFQLLEILGRGGMGEVWKARQASLGRTVAIKLLPPRLAEDPEFVARFEKEATALANLSHPNIIQIIDRGVAGEHYYFVMEYVEGRSLREVMQSARLSAADALRIVAQICGAIDYAHEKHIIHRDLKPENILLDGRGHVKVADFGLAGFRGHELAPAHLTATSVAMGTLNYMAPEQRRDAKNVDGRADLYSLGVILYELLTGELPLGRFKLPSERLSGLDLRVDEIVVKSLEPDPELRYQRASAIGSALGAVLPSTAVGGSGLQSAVAIPAPATSPATAAAGMAPSRSGTIVERGWPWLRTGLAVVGGLAILAVVVRAPWRDADAGTLVPGLPGLREKHTRQGGALPGNTDGQLYPRTAVAVPDGKRISLSTSFAPATPKDGEPFNAYDGEWQLEDGRLEVTQAGNVASNGKALRPRAYVADRYFSSDDFVADVEMAYQSVEGFKLQPGEQRYLELSFRIAGTNIAATAVPGERMRLTWRYFTPDGVEQIGNSALDPELSSVYDEIPTPPERTPFKVQLSLKKHRRGALVEGRMNGRRFASKYLVGLSDVSAKVAVGCRNLHCEFDDLSVKALDRPKPPRNKFLGARVEEPREAP